MKFRPKVLVLIFFAVRLLVSAAAAQSPFAPVRSVGFDTPETAAKALDEAGALQARIDLLPPVAAAYLRAHAYEALPSMISSLSVPGTAVWQRTFLLAVVHVILGNTAEAVRLIKQLPEAGLRDPVVLKFRIEHPDLFGDDASRPPPDLDSGTPEETAKNYLDTLEPDKAWDIIAAHPDRFLDDLGALHPLTAQIADQNLAPRLLPLLEERAKRQPENWELRLTLAQFQLLTGDTAGATESFRQVYTWKPDDPSPPPSPAERVAAMQEMSAYGLRQLNGTFVFSHVKTLENARDLALICLAKLADERREGAAFIHRLEEEYRNDEIGRITALMLINSPGLVLRELHTALAKGPSPGLDALATPWLRGTHANRMGLDGSQQERTQLAAAFARLGATAPQGASGSVVPSVGNPAWLKELTHVTEVSKSADPAVKEQFLAELAASTDSRIDELFLSNFLRQTAKQPDDAFFARGAAVLMAKAAADVDGSIAYRALDRASRWYPPRTLVPGEMGGNFMNRARGNRWPDAPAQPPPLNEQVEAMFLGQSEPAWSRLDSRMAWFRSEKAVPLPPTLAPMLEKLAGDVSSPLHVSARLAEAYLLHDVAGQEDHALDLLRQTIKESPSYAARFWLAAFLARRQQYKEAAEVFDSIKPVPGYFETFLQRGRTLLQRADKGGPLFEHEPSLSPPPSTKRPATITGLVADLQRIIDAKSIDPASSPQALAIATKLSAILPAEVSFPGRETVLKAFAKFGGLDEQTKQIEERINEFPHSADAQLALGDAQALSSRPEMASTSTEAYRQAFQLAPDRPDIAAKITGPGFTIREREDAYCVLLRQGATKYWNGQPDISTLFEAPDALTRYIRAYGEGFSPWGRRMISGNSNFRDSVAAWRKAGQDDTVIDMLTAVNHAAPPESDYYDEPEKLLVGLLNEKGRSAEAAAVVDRMLFPSEYLYGLDLAEVPPMSLLYPPNVLEFIDKVRTPEQMARFEDHARRIMAERPGDTRAPLVLLTLLILDHDPSLRAELPACLEALRAGQDDRPANALSILARMASTAPETKSIALDLLAEARRREAGKTSELATIELLAATALDLGDHERAEGALKEILVTAKAQKKTADLHNWIADLELMARCGMDPEAAELSALVYSQMAERSGHERNPGSVSVLAYIEACVQYGQPEMGRKALADFRRLLAADMADTGDPEHSQYMYRFDQKLLERMVEAFVSLDRADEAAQALRTLLESRMAAAAPELRARIESAQELLAQVTGGPGAMPVAFIESAQEREITLWWNVSARASRSDSWSRGDASVLGADLGSLDGRYAVEILGGDTPNHLTRLAVIPHAPGRGEWHGTPTTNPATIRFTRVILTDADGATVIGPSVPMSPGEERLGDPEMSEAIKAGTTSARWTLPEGVLSTVPGPIPGHPALAFVNKDVRPDCEIRGARIPVHPGESFVQSAWLRSAEGCHWGVRCFDAQGKTLTNGVDRELTAPYESPGWTRVEQRLDSAAEPPRSGRGRHPGMTLPSGTAFIEPVLTFSSHEITWNAKAPVRWAGLSLRSVPPIEDKPKTPERAPDQLAPEETPAPSLAADKASTARNEAIFAEFASAACQVAVSPESDMIVVGCHDGTLHFLEYPSGKEVTSVHAHDDPITDLAVLPAKAGVYSVDTRGDTHFVSINPEKDDLVACTAHHPSGMVLSPARKWVIFASDETREEPSQDKIRIEVIDLTTGKQVRLIEQPGLFSGLSLASDEKQFSVRQAGGSGYVVSSWELPTFNKLPDRTEDRGRAGGSTRPLFVADPTHNRYVMIETTGRFVVRTMDNEILWTFNPAPEATSLAVMPKDDAILVCKADGKIWRCISPK